MKLTELFSNNKQINGSAKTKASAQKQALINRQIHALKPGQTIQGELVGKNGSEVQLKLAEDFLLKARLEQNMNLDIGRLMTFEVKNNGQALTLLPLYTNTAMDANVLKALDMAFLPVNDSTVAMTEQMMQAGMSIDRNTMQQLFRECNLYPDSSMADIIDLHKLSLTVNEMNLAQLSSYKNMTHQLVEGFGAVADALPESMQNMLEGGNVQGAARLMQDVLNLIQGESAVHGDGNTAGAPLQGDLQQLLDLLAAGHGENSALHEEQGNVQDATAQGEGVANQYMQKENVSNEALNMLQRLLQQGVDKHDTALLRSLTGNKEIAAFIKENLQSLWTISPKEVADKAKVEELYERLGRQLKSLTQALEQAGQADSRAGRATANLTQNLDFIQQLNQTYTYLQLPLRLQQGKNAHGDLYVYSNKKHLAASDGKVTALLHLDMEHLGPLDVYVALQQEKVSTKFYLQNEEMLDFLESRMDILTERLRKRGYDCSCEMQTRNAKDSEEQPQSVMQRLLETEPQVPLVQYAFDVRT